MPTLRERIDTIMPTAGNAPIGESPAVSARAALARFWPDARRYRWRIALLVALAATVPLVEAATIWLYARLIDEVLVPRTLAPLGAIAVAYLGLTLLAGVAGFVERYLAAWTGERLLLDLRLRLFRHLLALPPSFFQEQKLGDLLARVDDDVDAVSDAIVGASAEAVSNLLKLIVFAGALVLIDWRLALIALLVAPPCWWAARRISARIRAIARQQRQWEGAVGAVSEEILANTTLVQVHNRQADELGRFERAARGDFASQLAMERTRAVLTPVVSLLELAGVLAVVAAGAWSLAEGRITLGALLAFLAYMGQLYGPVRALSHLAGEVAAAGASAERVIELLDAGSTAPASPAGGGIVPDRVRGGIAVEDVTYRYPGRAEPALRGASLTIEAGERVALVGPSGAGKSTLVSLLLRFADPDAGRIALDGHDLRALDLAALREAVAVVMQETLLLDASIRDNIAYGRPGATEAEIDAAARAADIDGFVSSLPEGYETRVGQRGRALSGGQRQRIAIARAMLRDAPVLVLDEPTTGLDEATARRILAPLRRLMEGRTTLLLSHDPLVVAEADRVVELRDGRIVPAGAGETDRAEPPAAAAPDGEGGRAANAPGDAGVGHRRIGPADDAGGLELAAAGTA
ncbi:MAG: ABC transporter ATP-binding protein [Thermomicrobiales bacterium]|nr:ABC transporter ATP-binding protein [Thermomicrobiales bacterium]